MPKGNASTQTYKASVVDGELKTVYYGLMATIFVKSPIDAVNALRNGKAFVYIHARQADKELLEKLWTG